MARKRKQQTRLELTPLPSSSPAAATYHQQIRNRAATVNVAGASHRSKRRKLDDLSARHESVNGSPALPTTGTSDLSVDPVTVGSDSEEDLPQLSSVLRRNARKGVQTTLHASFDNRSSTRTSRNLSSPSRNPLRSSPAPTPDSGVFARHTPRGLKRRRKDANNEGNDNTTAIPIKTASANAIELSGNESSDDSDQMPMTPAQRRRRRPVTVDSPDSGDSEKSDEPPKGSRLRRGRVRADSDDETHSAPELAAHALTQEEQQELDDDVNDLRSSSTDDEVRRPRKTAKSERHLALERLKRRRAGLAKVSDNEESDSDIEPPSDLDSDSDDVQELPLMSSARDMFDADEHDAEFLTDDGDDTMGAPEGLPLEFTRYASMKPKELFQYVVEWMVQKKLNPGFNMVDELYNLAFKKLDDEVKGLAGSKFESSAWRPEFIFTLRARPEIAKASMDKHQAESLLKLKCDACNRSGHYPTYEVQFQGKPYHLQTLEEVEQHDDSADDDDEDDDEEDDEEERATTRDAQGSIILPESHSFYVGKFCMANAETAHSLLHWRMHLYEWVVDKISELGYLTPEKIVQRDGWGEPKRRKFVNKVFAKFTAAGTVKQLYADFKAEVEQARNAKYHGKWHGSP